MSYMSRKERLSLSKIVLKILQGVTLPTEFEYDDDDRFIIRTIFTTQNLLFVDALANSSMSSAAHKACISYIDYAKSMEVEHLLGILEDFLSSIYNNLVAIEAGTFDFKSLFPRPVPYWVPATIKGIQTCLKDDNLDGLSLFCSFLRFPTRLPVKRPDFEQVAWEQFKQNEMDMLDKNLDLVLGVDEDGERLIEAAHSILSIWMYDFRMDARPAHGTGSTSQGYTTLWDKETHLQPLECCELAGYTPRPGMRPQPCRISFVPKSYKAVRTIGMEDVTLMYFQNMFDSAFRDFSKRSPYLRRAICFEDNRVYRNATRSGSLDNNLSTLDQSSASDRIPYELVRLLFPEDLFQDMELLRNPCYSYGGETYIMHKYAPMGSRLCFPVETLIFLSAAVLACNIAFGRALDDPHISDVFAYGDDITLPKQAVGPFLRICEEWGFKPNRGKSFFKEEHFRESCGFFYYRGAELSPVVCSRFFVKTKDVCRLRNAPRETRFFGIDKLIPLYNQLRHIYATASCEWIRSVLPKNVVYTNDTEDSTKLYSRYPNSNSMAFTRIQADEGVESPWYDMSEITTCRKSRIPFSDNIMLMRDGSIVLYNQARDIIELVSPTYIRELDGEVITPSSLALQLKMSGWHPNAEYGDRYEFLFEDSTTSDDKVIATMVKPSYYVRNGTVLGYAIGGMLIIP